MATIKQYAKKDGSKAWQFQTYLGINQATGKPVKTTRRGFNTKKEAQLELNRLVVEFEKNGLEKKNNETFKEVYELWLESYQTTVKEVTLLKNEVRFRKWILPEYGHLRIKEISVKNAQQVINKWAKETDQYKVLHSSSSRIFRYAMNLGIIENNPLERVIMPKREKKQREEIIKVYTKEELRQLFAYLDSQEGSYKKDYDKTIYRFLFYSGVRVGEALALSWKDIDFENKTANIYKTLSQTKNGYVVSTPKTASSTAKISLDNETLATLKKWQINQRKYMLTVGMTDPDLIFCGIYKQIISHHAIYTRTKNITENCGIPFYGVHVTRHTHASLLLESGANMKEVQDRLRHASIRITMDTYSHLSKESKEKTIENLVKHLEL